MRTTFVLALVAVTGCQPSSPRHAASSSSPSSSPPSSSATYLEPAAGSFGAVARRSADRARAQLSGGQVLEPDATLPDAKHDGAPRLAAADGKTTIEFPLAHTSVLADVTGNIARVEVTQLYQNPTAQRLEAVYQFPLPENAAVTDMMFRIGKRVVISEVQEARGGARRPTRRAKAEGHTAALTEQERPNLFTQSVANIPPGETVEVVIRYVHEVKFDYGPLPVPFPDDHRPPLQPGARRDRRGARRRRRSVAPGVRSAHDLDIVVHARPGRRVHRRRRQEPPHHERGSIGKLGKRIVALGDGDHVPNKDFILAWRPAGAQPDGARPDRARSAATTTSCCSCSRRPTSRPRWCAPRRWCSSSTARARCGASRSTPRRRVITQAIDKMGPDDTFQLIAFDSTTESMSAQPRCPTRPTTSAAARALARQRCAAAAAPR